MAEEQNWDRARWLWLAALVAGASFFVAAQQDWQGPAIIAWKTAGVGLLALWAAANARSGFGWMLVAVLAFGAVGDALFEWSGLLAGAAAFSVGHVIAIILYMRNRRAHLSRSQQLLAAILVPMMLVTTWGLIRAGSPSEIGAGVAYTGGVAAMAATAWISRFPRYRTGIGAMMFLSSDMLIFAHAGGWMPGGLLGWLIWPLYFGGQALIAWGVVKTLSGGEPARA